MGSGTNFTIQRRLVDQSPLTEAGIPIEPILVEVALWYSVEVGTVTNSGKQVIGPE